MTDDTRYLGETVSGDEQADDTERTAREIGKEHGTNAGSWVVDGNTPEGALRRLVAAADEGEFYEYLDPFGALIGPLSGEFADGYSLGQLSDDLAVDQESDEFPDLCTAYEDAYWQAFEDEAVRSARATLPDDEEGETR